MDSVSDGGFNLWCSVNCPRLPKRGMPGAARLEEMGLAYDLLPAPGTSEDVALLWPMQKRQRLSYWLDPIPT